MTDGIRYTIHERREADFQLAAYLRLLDICESCPVLGCSGAADAILSARRLSIKAVTKPAITITRRSLGKRKLVYIAKANRKFRYPFGRSAVACIGTTTAGARRVAASAANKAESLLTQHGVKQLDFHVIICSPRRNVETWRKLESALLLAFKHQYGTIPIGNTAG